MKTLEERDYLAEAHAIIRGETMILPQVEHLKALEDARRGSVQWLQILNKHITALDKQIALLTGQ
jgi:hypothetical protein